MASSEFEFAVSTCGSYHTVYHGKKRAMTKFRAGLFWLRYHCLEDKVPEERKWPDRIKSLAFSLLYGLGFRETIDSAAVLDLWDKFSQWHISVEPMRIILVTEFFQLKRPLPQWPVENAERVEYTVSVEVH